ncbi:Transcription factor vrtR1 [Fusarium oxysporum f. sp. albedinis]|nr:Transcription factor vrtR1 [Fusarium oxysporum f. sp. albedinis]
MSYLPMERILDVLQGMHSLPYNLLIYWHRDGLDSPLPMANTTQLYCSKHFGHQNNFGNTPSSTIAGLLPSTRSTSHPRSLTISRTRSAAGARSARHSSLKEYFS